MHTRRLAMVLLAVDLGCGEPTTACPSGTRVDDARARAMFAALQRIDSDGGPGPTAAAICFGGAPRGTVRPDGVVVLADWLDHPGAAARLIHMRMHLADGLHRFPAADVACPQQVEQALAAEARAMVAEIEACERLACALPPFTFAAEVSAAAQSERAGLVLARLRAEPRDDGLAALVDDYRERCERGE